MIYFGTIEDRSTDPARAGRYKVRVVGVHSPLQSELSTEDLPWAIPIQDNSAAISGIGTSSTGYLQGTIVAVIFADEDLQIPLILGSVAGLPQTTDETNSEFFDSISKDFAIIPPPYPPENQIQFKSGETMLASQVKQIPSDAKIIEPGYVGKLTASEIRKKLIPQIAKIREKNVEAFPISFQRVGIYKFSASELRRLGYLSDTDEWTGLNGINSRDMLEQQPQLQADAQEILLKLNYVDLSKIGAVTDKTPKEKLAGLLLAAQVHDVTEVGKWLEGKSDNAPNSLNETMRAMYHEGYKLIAGKDTEEDPTYDNVNTESVDKHTDAPNTDYSSIPTKYTKSNRGFSDPDNEYPLPESYGYADTPRLATGIGVNGTIVTKKEVSQTKNIPVANSTVKWRQSNVPYNAQYPHNRVFQSASGHVMEFDDTPGAERVHIAHRTGTFHEVDTDGNSTEKVVGIRTVIVEKGQLLYVKGDGHVCIDGDLSLKVNKAVQIEVSGDVNLNVHGNVVQQVSGNMDLSVHGNFSHSVTGNYSLNVAGNVDVKGSAFKASGGTVDIAGSSSLKLTMPQFSPSFVPSDGGATLWSSFASQVLGAAAASPVQAAGIAVYEPEIEIPMPPDRSDTVGAVLEDTDAGRMLSAITPEAPPKQVASDVAPPIKKIDPVKGNYAVTGDIGPSTIISKKYGITLGQCFVDNVPCPQVLKGQHGLTPQQIVENLRATVANTYEKILELEYMGKPLKDYGPKFNSAMRFAGNPLSHSSTISQHELGQALDISFTKLRVKKDARHHFYEIAKLIKEHILFDQLLLEYNTGGSVWLHISYKETGSNRRSVKTFYAHRMISDGLIEMV